MFYIVFPAWRLQNSPPPGRPPGRVGWHELHAADPETAFAFYANLFGWTKTEAFDMGPMGVYQTFATGGPTGAAMVGGMMIKTAAFPTATWLYYFNVPGRGVQHGRAEPRRLSATAAGCCHDRPPHASRCLAESLALGWGPPRTYRTADPSHSQAG